MIDSDDENDPLSHINAIYDTPISDTKPSMPA
jgi:hypothetical protein